MSILYKAFDSSGIEISPKPIYANTVFLSNNACEVFFDPFLRMMEPEIQSDQIREAIVGMTMNWRLLYVIYTMPEDDIFRIISARPVTKYERQKYEEQ